MSPVRLAISFRRPLDIAAYTALLNGISSLSVVASDGDLADLAISCQKQPVDAVLVDATFPGLAAFETARMLLAEGAIRGVVFLDDQFAVLRAECALAMSSCIYATRDIAISTIVSDLTTRLSDFGPFTSGVIIRCDSRTRYLDDRNELNHLDQDGFLSLTSRERQVAVHLTKGMSAKQTAAILGLKEHTIDNHKARLMKKLKLDKQTQLPSVALRAGLIDYPLAADLHPSA